MTCEEAIERFRYQDEHVDCEYDLCDHECTKCLDAFNLVIETLEKHIPKKPIISHHDHEEYFTARVKCGNCGGYIGSWDYGRVWCEHSKKYFIGAHKYCNTCGKRIDWSDEE